jgi:hypothetical protein
MSQTKLKKAEYPLSWEIKDDAMHVTLSPQMSNSLVLAQEGTRICVADLGRSGVKITDVAVDSETGIVTIIIRKITSHLAEVPAEKLVKATGFFKQQKTSAKKICFKATDDKGVTKTYAVGERAASLGGAAGLNQAKTVDMDKRLMGVMTALGIFSGEIALGVQIPFASGKQFQGESEKAQHLVKDGLRWELENKPRQLTLQDDNLRVAPEDYYSEYLTWELKYDRAGNEYPCWQGMGRLIVGLGFQTTNIGVIDEDDAFDPMLSQSIQFGVNQFYKYCAEPMGNNVNFEDPKFIELINSIATISPADEPPFETSIQVPGQAKPLEFGELKGFVESAKNSFFAELMAKLGLSSDFDSSSSKATDIASLFAAYGRFSVVGGGAYLFGDRLIETLDNFEGFVCPLPDVASALGMTLAVARGEF